MPSMYCSYRHKVMLAHHADKNIIHSEIGRPNESQRNSRRAHFLPLLLPQQCYTGNQRDYPRHGVLNACVRFSGRICFGYSYNITRGRREVKVQEHAIAEFQSRNYQNCELIFGWERLIESRGLIWPCAAALVCVCVRSRFVQLVVVFLLLLLLIQ